MAAVEIHPLQGSVRYVGQPLREQQMPEAPINLKTVFPRRLAQKRKENVDPLYDVARNPNTYNVNHNEIVLGTTKRMRVSKQHGLKYPDLVGFTALNGVKPDDKFTVLGVCNAGVSATDPGADEIFSVIAFGQTRIYNTGPQTIRPGNFVVVSDRAYTNVDNNGKVMPGFYMATDPTREKFVPAVLPYNAGLTTSLFASIDEHMYAIVTGKVQGYAESDNENDQDWSGQLPQILDQALERVRKIVGRTVAFQVLVKAYAETGACALLLVSLLSAGLLGKSDDMMTDAVNLVDQRLRRLRDNAELDRHLRTLPPANGVRNRQRRQPPEEPVGEQVMTTLTVAHRMNTQYRSAYVDALHGNILGKATSFAMPGRQLDILVGLRP